jgi:hypothetical protein
MFVRLSALLTILFCSCAAAEAGGPSVESVAPGVGQRGTEFRLRLVGAGLADAAEVLTYSRGITSATLEGASDNEVTVVLRAAVDCPTGSHPFRLRTQQGISEMRVFRVTPFPVVSETEPNGTVDGAQPVSRNVTIAGVVEAGDVDFFQVELRKGERLAAEVEGVRLGGTLLDTVLTVFGPDDKKIASVDDTSLFRQDPFVTIVAPIDGKYVVQVRETSFIGDENSRYALHLGTFPRPAWVYPAGGQAGRALTVQFGGDAQGAFEQRVEPADLPGGESGLFATHDGLASPTVNPFRVCAFPNVLEIEPNDTPDKQGGISSHEAAELPCAFNGILNRPGDVDAFRFRGEEGTTWQFESFGARLGSPIDSVISIRNPNGRVLVSNDDDGTHDSRLIFAPPASGEYVLTITDKRGEGGENFVYRVEADTPQRRVAAFLPRPNRLSQERQAISIPRGNRVMVLMGTQRIGFEGSVRLAARGLPSGVSFSKTDIPADIFCVPVVFEARADAPLAGALVDLAATGTSENGSVSGSFVQIVDLVAGTADALFNSAKVDRLAVAVVQESPLVVRLAEPKTELAQDGTLALEIQVERPADVDGPVDVTLPFLPPWVDGPEKITIPAGEPTAVYVARAFPQAEPRTWRLCAEAAFASSSARDLGAAGPPQEVRRKSRRSANSGPAVAVASQLVTLRLAASPVTGNIGAVVSEQGKDVTLTCDLKVDGTLPHEMTATLEGLPNRVEAEPVAVSSEDRKVTFLVQVEPTAPVGSFPSLVCRLSGALMGQEVSYCVGRGGVLKIQRAGGLVTDESGRALSPLEILRKSKK